MRSEETMRIITLTLVSTLMFLCSNVMYQQAKAAVTGASFQQSLMQTVTPGMSRQQAETQLKRLGVKFGYIPKEEFRFNIISDNMKPLDRAVTGALKGTKLGLGERGLMSEFAEVVVYLTSANAVREVHSQLLWSGP